MRIIQVLLRMMKIAAQEKTSGRFGSDPFDMTATTIGVFLGDNVARLGVAGINNNKLTTPFFNSGGFPSNT